MLANGVLSTASMTALNGHTSFGTKDVTLRYKEAFMWETGGFTRVCLHGFFACLEPHRDPPAVQIL